MPPKPKQTNLFSFFKPNNAAPAASRVVQDEPQTTIKEALQSSSDDSAMSLTGLPSPPASSSTRSSPTARSPQPLTSSSPISSKRLLQSSRTNDEEDEDDFASVSVAPKRLRRRLLDSDDEGDNNESKAMDIDPAPAAVTSSPTTSRLKSFAFGSSSPIPSPTAPKQKAFSSPASKASKTKETPSKAKETPSKAKETPSKATESEGKDDRSFLVDIRDANMRRPGDADYDKRTLYIPPSAWKTFTPFAKQYWEVKSKNFDAIVFFKKGFFYELYEMDADIGVQEFELNYSRSARGGEMRMVGFPCSRLEEWAAKVVAKGYKVARVDEMENSVTKNMREKKSGTKDKIIQRKLTSVLTSGTLVYSSVLTDDMATYCMAIKESTHAFEVENSPVSFGVVVLEAATAEFSFVVIDDDADRTQLETLLVQMRPTEIVCEQKNLSPATLRMIKRTSQPPIVNSLIKGTEFWTAEGTEDELRRHEAYVIKGAHTETDHKRFFDVISDDVAQSIKNPLLMSSFGGLLWYLRSLQMDAELLSQGRFRLFRPIEESATLILDGQTLVNLDVLRNSTTNGSEGTLSTLLNRCVTPMGKRLFQRWLCHPLRHVGAINERLDAVDDFRNHFDVTALVRKSLRVLPDLDRIVSRVRANNCKIKDFLEMIAGFQVVQKMMVEFRERASDFRSERIRWLMERFPDLSKQLAHFHAAIDSSQAASEGTVIPPRGTHQEFDDITDKIDEIVKKRDAHLEQQKKILKTDVKYKDVGSDLFQLEVPAKTTVPDAYALMSSTANVKRYWTPFLRNLVVEYNEALETKQEILRGVLAKIYEQFGFYYELWARALNVIAELDCIISLAESSVAMGDSCRPEIVEDDYAAFFEATALRHPTVHVTDYVPNDTYLGGRHAPVMLLTGPNMGGKSTILRQTCIAIILAQLGCYVPAQSCRLAPFDRIFTRIGASDNILAGNSTFMVELKETSRILANATARSLVILDELGRGTSTFDGYAIAYAVLSHLISNKQPITLFATHYHALTQEYLENSLVSLKHMACIAEEAKNEVVFLYKLTDGPSIKSFGMHVANLAGVPREVVEQAKHHAELFEKTYHLKEAAAMSSHGISLSRKADVSTLIRLTDDAKNVAAMRAIWRSLQVA